MIWERPRLKLSNRLCFQFTLISCFMCLIQCMSNEEIQSLRDEVKEMFYHGYNSYMEKAYPADELMPLSCRGRYRDSEPNRGDIDDALGNFSLTLVDTLDTLVIFNNISEFERGVALLVKDLNFDTDVVVSVFETNIRVLGGLLSGHIFSNYIKDRWKDHLQWYKNELLLLAQDLGYRLLPAFNTSTGIPHPRINLKFGMRSPQIINVRETCTSCAGTMILEFAALSRLTGEPIFEIAARKAMDYLWNQRHRSSDLVGTVLNIHNGDWVRRDSGVGAGIDSYYEYLLKGYILLGDETYLQRFNQHYKGIMKYVSQGPLLVDVHMHRPKSNAKNFMDSLLAFWPGLQVLKGDIKPAIATHEMLYQVAQRHNFLIPEAFSINDFEAHWSGYFLRPEFIESTYFLFKATGDHHYLEVGKQVMEGLQKYTRTECGFAAVKDVRTRTKEDRMDSFFLTETLKYLYLLFATKKDLIVDLDQFVFTTEAHFLPLSLSSMQLDEISKISEKADALSPPPSSFLTFVDEEKDGSMQYFRHCPNVKYLIKKDLKVDYVRDIRETLKGYIANSRDASLKYARSSSQSTSTPSLNLASSTCSMSYNDHGDLSEKRLSLQPQDFSATNKEHLEIIKKMGINVGFTTDGRIQLIHSAATAENVDKGVEGALFMQEMLRLSKQQVNQFNSKHQWLSFISPSTGSMLKFKSGIAQFGLQLKQPLSGKVSIADPIKACSELLPESNSAISGKIAIVERGECTFVQKARVVQKAGAIGCIVIDDVIGTTEETLPMFAMSGDGKDDVSIPVTFLYYQQGHSLMWFLKQKDDLVIEINAADSKDNNLDFSSSKPSEPSNNEDKDGSYEDDSEVMSPVEAYAEITDITQQIIGGNGEDTERGMKVVEAVLNSFHHDLTLKYQQYVKNNFNSIVEGTILQDMFSSLQSSLKNMKTVFESEGEPLLARSKRKRNLMSLRTCNTLTYEHLISTYTICPRVNTD